MTGNSGFSGWSGAPVALPPYVRIEDQKTSGTGGGNFASGAWRTRTLNTKVEDTGAIALLDTTLNQITLPPGTYRCHIKCPAISVNNHRARLQNITLGATLLLSNSAYVGVSTTDYATIVGHFTLTAVTVVEVQHQCSTTNVSGFGAAGSFGAETYTVVQLWKES